MTARTQATGLALLFIALTWTVRGEVATAPSAPAATPASPASSPSIRPAGNGPVPIVGFAQQLAEAGYPNASALLFTGTTLPAPPASGQPWSPPDYAPEWLVKPTELLFEQGMADPRGCEYREITVATGVVWSDLPKATHTHGWVLPPAKDSSQQFAVCWNGLVYPVLSVGQPQDPSKDIQALLAAFNAATDRHSFLTRSFGMPSEDDAVSFHTPLPLKIPLLMRIGEPRLAGGMWAAWRKLRPVGGPPDTEKAGLDYLQWSSMWVATLFDRTICAFLRQDDRLALLGLFQLQTDLPAIRKKSAEYASKRRHEGDATHGYLAQVPEIIADLERRKSEPVAPAAQATPRDQAARISALIQSLDQLTILQASQPGEVNFASCPTVKALINEGPAAVEPLLDCLENDTRLTRSVHFWRDFSPPRRVEGVQEPAYAALAGILKTSFFESRSSGDDLTARGPNARKQVAAAIREHLRKNPLPSSH